VIAAVDVDWNPAWAVDWQRHFVGVRALLAGGAVPADIVPGVTVRGEDVGRWLERQREQGVGASCCPSSRKR
jgi:hypothetical protein